MRLLYRLANWKTLIPLLMAVVYFTAVIFPDYQAQINTIANEKLTSLDTRFTYNREEVFTLFTKMTDEGRETYYVILSKVDSIYPLLYGSFFILLLSRISKSIIKPNSKWRFIIFLPLLTVIFDYFENIAIQKLLATYPDITEHHVTLASQMTQSKWLSLVSVLLLICMMLIILVINKLKLNLKSKQPIR